MRNNSRGLWCRLVFRQGTRVLEGRGGVEVGRRWKRSWKGLVGGRTTPEKGVWESGPGRALFYRTFRSTTRKTKGTSRRDDQTLDELRALVPISDSGRASYGILNYFWSPKGTHVHRRKVRKKNPTTRPSENKERKICNSTLSGILIGKNIHVKLS